MNGLTTDFDSNVGRPLQQFFNAPVFYPRFQLPNPLVFAGTTTYTYNPADGNLLLDIVITNGYFPYSSRDMGFRVRADDSGLLMSRVFFPTPAGGYVTDSLGLVTTFEFEPGAPVPEPAFGTLILLLSPLAFAVFSTADTRRRLLLPERR